MATQRMFALFQDVADAERAIGALEDHGIKRDQIGIAARRAAEVDEAVPVRDGYTRSASPGDLRQNSAVVSYEAQPGVLPAAAIASTAAPTSDVDTIQNVEYVGKDGITTTTPADAAAGAAVGTGVGLIAGLAVAAAALMIPGVGIILAGGALASAVGLTAGTTVAGAAVGGAVGYLRDMGMSEQAATHFADRVVEGDYLLTVVVDTEQYDTVKKLLMKYNAAGVDMNFAAAGEGFSEVTNTIPTAPTTPAVPLTAVPAVLPQMSAEEAFGGGNTTVQPGSRIITETADGVPIVPAQIIPPEEDMVL